MAEQQSAEMCPLISRADAENAFRKALGLFVGRGRLYSVDQLAKGSRVPARLIYCFLSYEHGHESYRRLNFGQVLSMTRFLGAEFTNEWLKLADQGAFDLPEEEPDPGELAADNCDDNATVVRAAVDGKFDQNERKDLKIVGTRMMNRGAQLVALRRTA